MSINLNFIYDECLACGSLEIQSNPAFFMPFITDRAFKMPMFQITQQNTGLKDIFNGFAYQYCNSLYCKSCGHLSCDLRFNDEQMKNLYHNYRGSDYLELREHYEPGYINRNNIFNKEYHYRKLVDQFITESITKHPISVLDWGGDSGINTPLKEKVKTHHIFDISNVEPINGACLVGEDEICKFTYDLVVCQHVIEHLPFPTKSINNLVKKINGNPLFYFEVPHEKVMRNLPANEFPKKIHWHEHINFYSEKSMAKLLSRCGLKVINLKSTNISRDDSEDTYILQCTAKLEI